MQLNSIYILPYTYTRGILEGYKLQILIDIDSLSYAYIKNVDIMEVVFNPQLSLLLEATIIRMH